MWSLAAIAFYVSPLPVDCSLLAVVCICFTCSLLATSVAEAIQTLLMRLSGGRKRSWEKCWQMLGLRLRMAQPPGYISIGHLLLQVFSKNMMCCFQSRGRVSLHHSMPDAAFFEYGQIPFFPTVQTSDCIRWNVQYVTCFLCHLIWHGWLWPAAILQHTHKCKNWARELLHFVGQKLWDCLVIHIWGCIYYIT